MLGALREQLGEGEEVLLLSSRQMEPILVDRLVSSPATSLENNVSQF